MVWYGMIWYDNAIHTIYVAADRYVICWDVPYIMWKRNMHNIYLHNIYAIWFQLTYHSLTVNLWGAVPRYWEHYGIHGTFFSTGIANRQINHESWDRECNLGILNLLHSLRELFYVKVQFTTEHHRWNCCLCICWLMSWLPDEARDQMISCHGIDLALLEYCCLNIWAFNDHFTSNTNTPGPLFVHIWTPISIYHLSVCRSKKLWVTDRCIRIVMICLLATFKGTRSQIMWPTLTRDDMKFSHDYGIQRWFNWICEGSGEV